MARKHNNDSYVYTHKNKTGVFYIGKGTHHNWDTTKFVRAHTTRNRNEEWHKEAEEGFSVDIIIKGLSHHQALVLEHELIEFIGIDNLTNIDSRKPNGGLFD